MQGIGNEPVLEESGDEEEDDEVPPSAPTPAAQVQAIDVLRQVLYATNDVLPRMLQDLLVFHESFRQKNALEARQTSIQNF